MRTVQCMLIAALIFLQTVPLQAADDVFSFYAEEAAVVHAAAKHAQSTREAPASATVITAEEIKAYGYRTLGEALQYAGGMYTADDRNYTYLWVRGLGRPGNYNSRILLLVNGHRTNENVFQSSFLGWEFPVDMDHIKQIEVIKGPGSALYGTNAISAVINVVTKTAADAPAAQLNAERGSFGTYKAFGSIAHKIGDKDGVYAGGALRRMKGRDFDFSQYPAFAAVNNGMSARNDQERSDTFFSNLGWKGFSVQGAFATRTKNVPTSSSGTRINQPGLYGTDSRSFAEFKMDHEPTPGLKLISRIYFDRFYFIGRFPTDNIFPPPDILTGEQYVKDISMGEEVMARIAPEGSRYAITVGQDYETPIGDRTLDLYYREIDLSVLNIKDKASHYAFFAQTELRPWDPLNVTLGGRYDRYQSFTPATTPRAALVYSPRSTSHWKVLYGEAFRAPSSYERLLDVPGFAKSNLDLKPESIRTVETHWIEEFDKQSSVSLGYFHNDVYDLIAQITDPSDGLIQFRNTKHLITDGIELSAKWIIQRLSTQATYIYQKTRESGSTSTFVPNSPAHVGTLGLTYRTSAWSSVSLSNYLIGRRRTVQGTTLPLVAINNLHASLTPFGPAFRVYASIFNLFDTDYRQTGGEEHIQDALPQDGRSFNVGLEYKFGPSK